MKKTLTLFICFIVLIVSVNAQYRWVEKKYGKPITEFSQSEVQFSINKAKSMKTAGVVLTTLGGVFLLTYAIIEPIEYVGDNYSNFYTADGLENIGEVFLALSIVMLTPGIPLWIIGNHRYSNLWKLTNNVYAKITPSLQWTLVETSTHFMPGIRINLRF